MEFAKGQVVYSKSGRDKGLAFIIVDVQSEYIYLADGVHRVLTKPKKKKIKHVQPTKYIDLEMQQKLKNDAYLNNKDLEKAIDAFLVRKGGNGKEV